MPSEIDYGGPRRILSLSQKLNVIKFYKESKCSLRKLAAHFNIGKTQAGQILKKQDYYLEQSRSTSAECGSSLSPSSVGFQIDKYVYNWYVATNKLSTTVTAPMIQQKALRIAKIIGVKKFMASTRWLGRFLKRHKINLKASTRDENTTDTIIENDKYLSKDLDEWEDQLSLLLSNYSIEDVYTAGKTGLFFQALPGEIISLKDETCSNGKLSPQRMTLLLCSSMTGAKECPLIVTNLCDDKLATNCNSDYQLECNPMAFMTHSILTEWLKELDKKMIEENRNIILFLHFSLNHDDTELKNIKIAYYPPDLPTDIQPMNHGIIQNFKMHYRRQLLECLINLRETYENEKAAAIKLIDITRAITWVVDAWKEVNKSVIQQSFMASGFYTILPDINPNYDDPSLNDVSALLCACDSDINATDYVNIDANLETEAPEEAELIENLIEENKIIDDNNDNNSELTDVKSSNDLRIKSCDEAESSPKDVKPFENLKVKTYDDAVNNLKDLENFYLFQNDLNSLSLVKQLITHNEIERCSMNKFDSC